jgi:hypothetical protein
MTMGQLKVWVLKYWGPDLDGRKDKGQQSFANEGTAKGEARRAARSRQHIAPASHVTVTHRETGACVFEWHGPATDQPTDPEALEV